MITIERLLNAQLPTPQLFVDDHPVEHEVDHEVEHVDHVDHADHHRVAVIGAGFGGLGAAVELAAAGIDDVIVLERADGVVDATWHEESQRWVVTTTAGRLSADIVISTHGPLDDPSRRDLPDLESFAGDVVHSATWDHAVDLAGRRVAVIGTGASAVQFVPAIAPAVDHMDVYQRSPAWVVPRPGGPVPERPVPERPRRLPLLRHLHRAGHYVDRELIVSGLASHPALGWFPEQIARRHLERQIADPRLRAALTPRHPIGRTRILLSDDWYPTFTRPHVDLVTDAIAEVRERSIVAADGTERAVDTIVVDTGFPTTDPPIAGRIRGRRGQTLAEAWADTGVEAHRGTTVSGFPNLFLLVGPDTGLGPRSITFMVESQIDYLLDALRTMQEWEVTSFDVHPEAQRAYTERIRRELDVTWRFRRDTRRFDPGAYHLSAHHPIPVASPTETTPLRPRVVRPTSRGLRPLSN